MSNLENFEIVVIVLLVVIIFNWWNLSHNIRALQAGLRNLARDIDESLQKQHSNLVSGEFMEHLKAIRAYTSTIRDQSIGSSSNDDPY